jgi:hypothetical protein
MVRCVLVSIAIAACGQEAVPQRVVASGSGSSSGSSATTAVEPPRSEPCAVEGYEAPAGAALSLLARQATTGRATVDVGLHNAGDVAVCVFTHVETHEIQNDWLTIQYADGAKYHHASRVIRFDDARDKSAAVSALLGPGQTLWQSVDADQWALRSRNGKEPLPAGSLYAQAAWDSTKETRVWAGALLSAPFELVVK